MIISKNGADKNGNTDREKFLFIHVLRHGCVLPPFVSFANDTGREEKMQDGILAKKHERALTLLCNTAETRSCSTQRPRIDGARKS